MRRHVPLVAVAIAAITTLVFLRSLDGAFLDWDDDRNFLLNPHYRGLGWDNVRWMFTSATLGHWIPVSWLTLGLDHVLWGMEPSGYHLTNVVLHALNAALVFLVARRLLAAALDAGHGWQPSIGAAAAALFWALHPLRVESVAWITERRDVLSGVFYLLTVLGYLRAAERTGAARARWLALSLAAYALALMSKSMVMTLPVVLAVIDVYPLRRLPPSWRAWWSPRARRVWREKAAYAALAAVGAVIALAVLARTLPLTPADFLPYAARPLVFLYDVAFYLWKTAVPVGLSAIYELPVSFRARWLELAAAAATSLALTVAFVLLRRRFPAGLAVWVAYAATIAPVGGLVHNGPQIAADRYSYLACLGWAVLVGAAVAVLAARRSTAARAALAGGAVLLAVLGALTWRQIGVWRDSETLYLHAIAVDPDCARCQRQLGAVLGNRGDFDAAIEHFRRAVALRPDLITHRGNIGLALLMAGRPAEAVPEFRAVLAAYPDNAAALTNLGLSLLAMGRPTEAIAHLERAAAVDASSARTRVALVRAYRGLGRYGDAARHATALERLDPPLATQVSAP